MLCAHFAKSDLINRLIYTGLIGLWAGTVTTKLDSLCPKTTWLPPLLRILSSEITNFRVPTTWSGWEGNTSCGAILA